MSYYMYCLNSQMILRSIVILDFNFGGKTLLSHINIKRPLVTIKVNL